MTNAKYWDEYSIRQLLNENDRAVEKALIVLFNNQTDYEQVTEATEVHNDRGFTSTDARFFTSLAKQVMRGHHLSEKQLGFLRAPTPRFGSRIGKYHRQLLEVVQAKQQKEMSV